MGVGTGLGLATVYGIVRQSGGWIRVYSEPGRGAMFQVYFPRVDGPAEAPAAPAREAEDDRGSETVLVVEDQPEVRRLALTILSQKGYRLLEASNGAEALALAANYAEPIDLLLTDVVMPGMTGRELAGRLLETRPTVKVLFTSGYTAEAISHQEVLDAGAAYLPKPFTASQLALKIREILGTR
jgi:CheY-like chemotaxis protein